MLRLVAQSCGSWLIDGQMTSISSLYVFCCNDTFEKNETKHESKQDNRITKRSVSSSMISSRAEKKKTSKTHSKNTLTVSNVRFARLREGYADELNNYLIFTGSWCLCWSSLPSVVSILFIYQNLISSQVRSSEESLLWFLFMHPIRHWFVFNPDILIKIKKTNKTVSTLDCCLWLRFLYIYDSLFSFQSWRSYFFWINEKNKKVDKKRLRVDELFGNESYSQWYIQYSTEGEKTINLYCSVRDFYLWFDNPCPSGVIMVFVMQYCYSWLR